MFLRGVIGLSTVDEVLIQRCRNGDLDAFEQIMETYKQKVYNLAYRMTGNAADASDLSQEVFLRVYRSLDNFRGDSSFSTWLYRIATNVCLDELRRRNRKAVVPIHCQVTIDHEQYRNIPDLSYVPELVVQSKELQQEIQEIINSLNPQYRLVIILRDIQGYSYEEIGEITNSSIGTVKSRLSRARKSLKKKIIRYWEQKGQTFRLSK